MKKLSIFLLPLLISFLFLISCSSSITDTDKNIKDEEEDLKFEIIEKNPVEWVLPSDENNEEEKEIGEDGLNTLIQALKEEKIDITWYTNNWQEKKLTIDSADGLRGLAWLVNNNKDNFYGKEITLIKTEANQGVIDISELPWIPIGEGSRTTYSKDDGEEIGYVDDALKVYRFCGIFDGGKDQGVTIRGLTDRVGDAYYQPNWKRVFPKGLPTSPQQGSLVKVSYGLFGLVRGEVQGEGEDGKIITGIIKNTKLEDVNILMENSGSAPANDGTGRNILFIYGQIGALIGQTRYGFEVSNCEADGSIYSFQSDVGGLVGATAGQKDLNGKATNTKKIVIKDSISNVTVDGQNMGGIIGRVKNVDYVQIEGCKNYGPVGSKVNSLNQYAGGVIGFLMSCKTANLNNLINTGKIRAQSCGGIIGYVNNSNNGDSYEVNISSSTNSNTIGYYQNSNTGALNAGGIIGYIYGNNPLGKINCKNSTNNGSIQATAWAGGVIGQVFKLDTINLNEITLKEETLEIVSGNQDQNNPNAAGCGTLIGVINSLINFNVEKVTIEIKSLVDTIPDKDKSGLLIAKVWSLGIPNGEEDNKLNLDFKNIEINIGNIQSLRSNKDIRIIGNDNKIFTSSKLEGENPTISIKVDEESKLFLDSTTSIPLNSEELQVHLY